MLCLNSMRYFGSDVHPINKINKCTFVNRIKKSICLYLTPTLKRKTIKNFVKFLRKENYLIKHLMVLLKTILILHDTSSALRKLQSIVHTRNASKLPTSFNRKQLESTSSEYFCFHQLLSFTCCITWVLN